VHKHDLMKRIFNFLNMPFTYHYGFTELPHLLYWSTNCNPGVVSINKDKERENQTFRLIQMQRAAGFCLKRQYKAKYFSNGSNLKMSKKDKGLINK